MGATKIPQRLQCPRRSARGGPSRMADRCPSQAPTCLSLITRLVERRIRPEGGGRWVRPRHRGSLLIGPRVEPPLRSSSHRGPGSPHGSVRDRAARRRPREASARPRREVAENVLRRRPLEGIALRGEQSKTARYRHLLPRVRGPFLCGARRPKGTRQQAALRCQRSLMWRRRAREVLPH
jgi:hypothetical protein